jgi:hypothetical protein
VEVQVTFTNALTKIGTPPRIVQCIQYGLTTYEQSQEDSTLDTRAPTYGSLNPLDVTLTQALHAQTKIGWENFLRGRISLHWRKAYTMSKKGAQPNAIPAPKWTSALIWSILEYSSALWSFRNGVVHGHTIVEEKQKRLAALSVEITQAYEQYNQDTFIVSHHLSSLFDKPVQYITQGDIDFQTSWLCTYKEAVITQKEFRHRQSIAAREFFKPRKSSITRTRQDGIPDRQDADVLISSQYSEDHTASSAATTTNSLSVSSTSSLSLAFLDESSADGTLKSYSSASAASTSPLSPSSDDESDMDSMFDPIFA